MDERRAFWREVLLTSLSHGRSIGRCVEDADRALNNYDNRCETVIVNGGFAVGSRQVFTTKDKSCE